MRIVLLSHTGRSSVFRVGSHHLARELAAQGHEVLQISNPLSLAHVVMWRDVEVRRRARLAVPLRLHRIDGADFVVPWSVFPLTPDPLHHPLGLGSRRLLMRLMRKTGFVQPDLLLVDQPLFDYLIPPIDARQVIYRPTDINVDPLTRAAEDRVMRVADGVVATSQVVADELARRHPGQSYRVVENGAETNHFTSSGRAWSERRGAAYVGALDRRFDWAAVIALGRSQPAQAIDVYGPQLGQAPDLPGNVRLRGPVDYAVLPKTLSSYRVGLLPLNDDPTNSGRSPMKLYEYLASGLNVVTRWTRPTSARPLEDVYLYTDAASAATAYATALTTEPTGDGARAAAEMDWSKRAEMLLSASMSS